MAKGEKCPFCDEIMDGYICSKCGAYDVVKGFENKNFKNQPYNKKRYI